MDNYSHQQIGKAMLVVFVIATLLILWTLLTADFGYGAMSIVR